MHGGTDEPNLVPLLDLILQLVMFFMACTNFAKENISEAVRLPLAQSAKPIEEEDIKTEKIYLNVEEDGDMHIRSFVDDLGTTWYAKGKIDDVVSDENGNPIPGPDGKAQHDPRLRRERIDKYFQRVYDSRAKRVKRDLGPGADEEKLKSEVAGRTLIVLRAHQQADFRDVYEILNNCRKVGFTKMQLRATMDTKHP